MSLNISEFKKITNNFKRLEDEIKEYISYIKSNNSTNFIKKILYNRAVNKMKTKVLELHKVRDIIIKNLRMCSFLYTPAQLKILIDTYNTSVSDIDAFVESFDKKTIITNKDDLC